jgi:hypothetical protein
MRRLIVFSTLVGILAITSTAAQSPKVEDVPKNIGLLKNSSSAKDRAFAAEELGRRGAIRLADVKEAFEPLREAVKKDSDANVRRAAAAALGKIAPEADKTVPVLTEALKDKSVIVKMAAATSLGQFGEDAKSALPALRELAKDKADKKLSQAAIAAIKVIAGKKK